jgi:hypothetical protein
MKLRAPHHELAAVCPNTQGADHNGAFILTDISEHRYFAGKWGFEVFTSTWECLAHFTFCSEKDAYRALQDFTWVMKKCSSVSYATKAPGR